MVCLKKAVKFNVFRLKTDILPNGFGKDHRKINYLSLMGASSNLLFSELRLNFPSSNVIIATTMTIVTYQQYYVIHAQIVSIIILTTGTNRG